MRPKSRADMGWFKLTKVTSVCLAHERDCHAISDAPFGRRLMGISTGNGHGRLAKVLVSGTTIAEEASPLLGALSQGGLW